MEIDNLAQGLSASLTPTFPSVKWDHDTSLHRVVENIKMN